jgi:predicted site-specific integrase-resolvase
VSVNTAPPLLKKAEVAAMFRVSERTIESWVRKGILRATHWDHTVRFDQEAILKQVREQQL